MMTDFYGQADNYIHLKFGDMRKMYNFTDEFWSKYPNFCKEYAKYFQNDDSCRFKSALEVAQYVDLYEVPVKFYFNYTDTPVKDITEVYSYFIREYSGITRNEDGSWRDNYGMSLDNHKPSDKTYKVVRVEGKE